MPSRASRPLVERCEQDHDHVLMVCGGGGGRAPGRSSRRAGRSRGGGRRLLTAPPPERPRPGASGPGGSSRSRLLALASTRHGALAGVGGRLSPAAVQPSPTRGAAGTSRRRTPAGRDARSASCSRAAARAPSRISAGSRRWSAPGLCVDQVAGRSWAGSSAGCSLTATTARRSTPLLRDVGPAQPINDYTIPAGLICGRKADNVGAALRRGALEEPARLYYWRA